MGLVRGYGKYHLTNGVKYEGGWVNNRPEGFGMELWPDGSKYEGYYKEGRKSGAGKSLHELCKW